MKKGLSIQKFKGWSGRMMLILFALPLLLQGQQSPELETTLMKTGQVWIGVTGHAHKGQFDFRAGFFPNDYEILGFRGQHADATNGSGFDIGCKYWPNPYAELASQDTFPVYGTITEWTPIGKNVAPLENYIRYKYPDQEIDFEEVELEDAGVYDPSQFGDYTYDQFVTASNEYIHGIQMHRKLMMWGQQYNDNYIIIDVVFENPTDFTFDSLYISLESNYMNAHRSYGSNPYVSSSEQFNPRRVWQHYYGGRVGDSLRVFYEYSADDPDLSGDDMGAPVVTQRGRMLGAQMFFHTFLHVSENPYTDESEDVDDFLQPRTTYVGTSTKIPYNQESDQYGSKNYWALTGGYSDFFPMSGNTFPGTHHGGNTDEQGTSDYSDFPAGTKSSTNSKMYSVCGPYYFEPGQKLRIVYAVGVAGLDTRTAKEVGEKWMTETLEDPPGLPDPETGYFPSNFVFPTGASENDKRKDRWLSTGIDSVMKSASMAKFNFETGYKIPQAPPPPETFTVTGLGKGVEILWSGEAAEAQENFAGYRIMRRISNLDTVYYQAIYDSDELDKASEHEFIDTTILYGAQYYYYIQSKSRIAENDPNAYPGTQGEILYSSRLAVPNIYWVNPPRKSSDDMSGIRIAPNPYNINDPLLETYGFTDQRGIVFFNLPGTCTIKIYTENGDLVQTIEHDSPAQSGSITWDMLTSSQQVINSGVYIAVFEKPGGEIAYHKFIVVR